MSSTDLTTDLVKHSSKINSADTNHRSVLNLIVTNVGKEEVTTPISTD